jgi:radical SAM family uncharacterized protein
MADVENNDRLLSILPLVKRPIRYTNGEYNLFLKEPQKDSILVALVFPDIYEIGMSNYGLRVIQHFLNRLDDVVVERAYAPWVDLAQELNTANLPLASIESFRPLKEFDIVGLSLQSELSFTNILYILDLAQIPFYSSERKAKDPLIIAGGPACVNPLPVAPFIDAFVIGDGEAPVLEIVECYRNWDRKNRSKLLEALARVKGVWVPLVHKTGERIVKQNIPTLKEEDFPYPPVLPIGEITHDRLVIEIARGCVRTCRFCQACIIHRPLRLREPDQIVRLAERGIRSTGWEEVSLLSLSALDYPELDSLIAHLIAGLRKRQVAVSLPSMRGECFTEGIADRLRSIKKTGLTFAPETASPRLQKVINKPIAAEDLFRSLAIAFNAGWRGIKLYFMIGLPTEDASDVEEIGRFLKEVSRVARRQTVKVNIAPFVPKPHTPFQWAGFNSIELLKEKINFVLRGLARNIQLKRERPEASYLEAVLARGDERLSDVIGRVYAKHGFFQEWTEFFNYPSWLEAFAEAGIDPDHYLSERPPDEPLPWNFIDLGVSQNFLKNEWSKAMAGESTADCSLELCARCQACPGLTPLPPLRIESLTADGPPPKIITGPVELKRRLRLKYQAGERFRFASHLDLVRAFYRTLRRSELPIVYSKGFSPRPLVSFGPPRAVGITSRGEYLDIEMTHFYSGNIIRDLNPFLPQDLMVVEMRPLPQNAPSLSQVINLFAYQVTIPPEIRCDGICDKQITGVQEVAFEPPNTALVQLRLGAKPFDTLAQLFDLDSRSVYRLRVERLDCYILRDSKLSTPLEDL